MQKIFIITFLLITFSINYYSQSTTIKLPTTDNTSSFNITNSSDAVGLKLFGDAGFYFGGNFGTGTIPIEGDGARLMWYPKKAAFRAGFISGGQWDQKNQWNDINIGNYSIAMGCNTTASGEYSTAMGYGNYATGSNSTAMGSYNYATGSYSTAIGYCTNATGNYSTAIGTNLTADGLYSTALGKNVRIDGHTGSFIIGDNFGGSYICASTADNEMKMRFEGGYRLFTDGYLGYGVFLDHQASSWSSVSDSSKKENFLKADGEYFLHSLSNLKLGSWNYKTKGPKSANVGRHYGPMAQEIFHYFGKDKLGVIGNDTTLATADMDGIMMICLQALEKRTSELKKAEENIDELINITDKQNEENIQLRNKVAELERDFNKILIQFSSLMDKKESQTNLVSK